MSNDMHIGRIVRSFLARRWEALVGIGAACVTLVVLSGAYTFVFARVTVDFDYGRQACFTDPTLFPELFDAWPSASYRPVQTGIMRIGGVAVLSKTTCIEPIGVAAEDSREVTRSGLLGSGILAKRYTIATSKRPVLASLAPLDKPLSIRDPLLLRLDTSDIVHDYFVKAGGRVRPCSVDGETVRCDIAPLGLAQDANYDMRIEQYMDGHQTATVAARKIRTTLPVSVVRSSIAARSVVYDKPGRLTLEVNQPLVSADAVLESIAADGKRTPVPARVQVDGTMVVIVFAQPLQRQTAYELTLKDAKGRENGFLERPHVVPFSTSGAPKVAAINIGKRSVSTHTNLIVRFDQPLKPGTDYARLVTLKSAGAVSAVAVSAAGDTLTIRPQRPLAFCGSIDLRIHGEVANGYDVSGAVSWTYASRAICHTVVPIGTSAAGRAIQSYRFGSGPSMVLYVGATHGDERGTKSLLETWINELDTYPDRIPAGRSIVIIPNLNPDGYAANTRRNARNVDLNRNFPAGNWKSDVTMPGGQLVRGGGGAQALSEPESQALAAFVEAHKPRLVLTYHSIGALVQPNNARDSVALAGSYSASSRYYVLSASAGSPFDYDTTGAFEDWLHDKLGLPALVIELSSHGGSDWSRNSAAMWKMAQVK